MDKFKVGLSSWHWAKKRKQLIQESQNSLSDNGVIIC